jgi:hypothetical protein
LIFFGSKHVESFVTIRLDAALQDVSLQRLIALQDVSLQGLIALQSIPVQRVTLLARVTLKLLAELLVVFRRGVAELTLIPFAQIAIIPAILVSFELIQPLVTITQSPSLLVVQIGLRLSIGIRSAKRKVCPLNRIGSGFLILLLVALGRRVGALSLERSLLFRLHLLQTATLCPLDPCFQRCRSSIFASLDDFLFFRSNSIAAHAMPIRV